MKAFLLTSAASIGAPILLGFILERKPLWSSVKPILVGILAIVCVAIVMLMPAVGIFKLQTMNWQGQLLSFFVGLALIKLFRLSDREAGVRIGSTFSSARWSFIVGVFLSALSLGVNGLQQPTSHLFERLVYQMTMPGLAEECMFRGFLLPYLNRYFPRRFSICSVPFGYGLIVSAVPFCAAHLLSAIDAPESLLSPYFWFVATYVFVGGFLLGLLKEKFDSLWPSVFAHNIANTLELLVVAVFR